MKQILGIVFLLLSFYSLKAQDISLNVYGKYTYVNTDDSIALVLANMSDVTTVPVNRLRPTVSFPPSVGTVTGANIPEGWTIFSNNGTDIFFVNTTAVVPPLEVVTLWIKFRTHATPSTNKAVANMQWVGPQTPGNDPNNDGNSSEVVSQAAPVPVAYTQDLKADKAGNSVNLSWKTGVESNSKGFAVQRSADGTNYSTLGFVQAKGSNSAYTYSDHAAVSGVNHYRLEQLDADGRKTYSNVVTVNFDGVSGLSVYPNPATTQVTVKATDLVQVYDLSGKLVLSQQPVNGTAVINISKLAKGTYVLKSGKTSGKFVKL